MQKWLLSRLFDLAEQPAPHYAFFGTVNWMRALALRVEGGDFDLEPLGEFYSAVEPRAANAQGDTLVFENIFLAFNHVAGLMSISEVENGYDVCRPAISAWYHGIYSAAIAMVAAATGTVPGSLEESAVAWNAALIDEDLVRSPFSLALSTLVKEACDEEIDSYRGSNAFDLSRTPQNANQAWGGIVSYLKGTAEYERSRVENVIRTTPQFQDLGVANFRTKAARSIRDSHLQNMKLNFLVQAWRYVGKASYRDSIFLSYGENRRDEIDQFLVDLGQVATAFLQMACAYCSRKVEPGTWGVFVDDIEANSRLSLDVDLLRV